MASTTRRLGTYELRVDAGERSRHEVTTSARISILRLCCAGKRGCSHRRHICSIHCRLGRLVAHRHTKRHQTIADLVLCRALRCHALEVVVPHALIFDGAGAMEDLPVGARRVWM